MFSSLNARIRTRAGLKRKAGELYGVIVTQARQPDFYLEFAIPDTPEGRYELVVVHLFLTLERQRQAGRQGAELSLFLIEMFVTDMDDSLRELGTSDVSVGKHVRRAVAGFYERSSDYRMALSAGEDELAAALSRHLGVAAGPGGKLARYVRAANADLAAQDGATLMQGRISFPPVIPAREGP